MQGLEDLVVNATVDKMSLRQRCKALSNVFLISKRTQEQND